MCDTCSAFLKEIYSNCSLTYKKIKFFSIYRENISQTFSGDATEQRGIRGTCTSPNYWISVHIFSETSFHLGENRSEILPNSGEYVFRICSVFRRLYYMFLFVLKFAMKTGKIRCYSALENKSC